MTFVIQPRLYRIIAMDTLSFAADIASIIAVFNEALEELEKCKGKQGPGYDIYELDQIESSVDRLHHIFDHVLRTVADEDSLPLFKNYRVWKELKRSTRDCLGELLRFLRDPQYFEGFMRREKLTEIRMSIEKSRMKAQVWLRKMRIEESRLPNLSRPLKIPIPSLKQPNEDLGDRGRPVEPINSKKNLPDIYADSMEARWKRFYEKVVFLKAEEEKPPPQTDSPRSYYVKLTGLVRLKYLFIRVKLRINRVTMAYISNSPA